MSGASARAATAAAAAAAPRRAAPGLRPTSLPRRGAAATDLRARLRGRGALLPQGRLLPRRTLSARVARVLCCALAAPCVAAPWLLAPIQARGRTRALAHAVALTQQLCVRCALGLTPGVCAQRSLICGAPAQLHPDACTAPLRRATAHIIAP